MVWQTGECNFCKSFDNRHYFGTKSLQIESQKLVQTQIVLRQTANKLSWGYVQQTWCINSIKLLMGQKEIKSE